MPVMVSATNVNRLSGVTRRTISEVERSYRQYCVVIDEDKGEPDDSPGKIG